MEKMKSRKLILISTQKLQEWDPIGEETDQQQLK